MTHASNVPSTLVAIVKTPMIKLIFVSAERVEDEAARFWVSKAVACLLGVDSFVTCPLEICFSAIGGPLESIKSQV